MKNQEKEVYDMTFEQLRYFIAVIECDTFFDAAESLHISQSTLSKQIMKLEKELDLKLLDRSHRRALPTEAGTLFYEEALQLHKTYTHALSRIHSYKASHSQNLRIGTLPFLAQYQLIPLFKEFTERYPSTFLDEVEDEALLHGLEESYYDLIIARHSIVNAPKYTTYPLVTDELVVVLPASHRLASSHRLAACPSLSLKDLINEKLLLMPNHTSIYQTCIVLFHDAGITPNILRTVRVESILMAVEIGEGITLLPKRSVQLFAYNHLVSRSLEEPVMLNVVIAKKKSTPLTAHAKKFIQFLTGKDTANL